MEIYRNISLSNGIFYRYFKNKEEVFIELLDQFLFYFEQDLKNIGGETVSQRLIEFLDIIIEAGLKHRKMITVFREGQYRFPGYEKKLRMLYLKALARVYGREVSESEYLFITSGIRFLSIRSIYNEVPIRKNPLQDMIENGLFFKNPSKYLKKISFPWI